MNPTAGFDLRGIEGRRPTAQSPSRPSGAAISRRRLFKRPWEVFCLDKSTSHNGRTPPRRNGDCAAKFLTLRFSHPVQP